MAVLPIEKIIHFSILKSIESKLKESYKLVHDNGSQEIRPLTRAKQHCAAPISGTKLAIQRRNQKGNIRKESFHRGLSTQMQF